MRERRRSPAGAWRKSGLALDSLTTASPLLHYVLARGGPSAAPVKEAVRREENRLSQSGIKLVAKNKKARFDFEILATYEAGIALLGTEMKSLRGGRIQLTDGFVRIEGGEAFLCDIYIAPYPNAGPFNHEPTRPRKLLLHKREIRRFGGKVQEKGLSIVPLSVYLKNSKAKVEIGLGRGKRKYEKREAIKRKDAGREIQRSLRQRSRES